MLGYKSRYQGLTVKVCMLVGGFTLSILRMVFMSIKIPVVAQCIASIGKLET